MEEPKVYILRIMEGVRCVAEAPLIVHDKDAARLCWIESYGQIAGAVVGAVFSAVIAATDEKDPMIPGQAALTIQGNHSGIQLAREMPGARNGGGV